jgi:small subunit ribosomal protein S6
MARRKNSYELTYIVNSVLSDEQIKNVVKRISEFIEENGGKVSRSDEWGTRRLAYPIRKKRNGYYVNLFFDADAALIARLERMLEIDDDILRYMSLRLDAVMLRYHSEVRDTSKLRAEAKKAPIPAAAAKKDDDAEDEDEDEDSAE